MSWNYRVIVTTVDGGIQRKGVHEVYYNKKTGRPEYYTVNPVQVVTFKEGELWDGLEDQLFLMLEACARPELTEADFPDGAKQ